MRSFLLLLTCACGVAMAEDKSGWDVNAPAYSVDPRTVPIDTNEGTWMSLDVSPTGEHIAFDLLGDLYLLPIAGGDAQPLTSGLAWDMQPRFSPDGRHLAFTSDRSGGDNIWTLELENSALQQISFETFRLLNNPAWHPDGQTIAARKHFTTSRSLGTGEIWAYHAQLAPDSKQTGLQIVERPSKVYQKELGEPIYATDGKTIYYTQNATPGNTFIYRQDSNGQVFHIKAVDLATGTTTVVAGGPGGAVRPTPSPDGRTLAYVKRIRAQSRLFVKDLTTGEERMLDDSLDPDMQETWGVHGLYPNMDFTPDGQTLIYWARGKIWRVNVAGGERSEIPFRVNDTRKVFPAPRPQVAVAPDTFATQMVRFARPSPNGEAVVFESLGRLYVKRGDGEPEPLTPNEDAGFDYHPVWSADGRNIFFLRWQDASTAQVRRVRAAGGRSRTVSDFRGHLTDLAAAPDGATLAVRANAGNALRGMQWGEQPGLYTIDVASGEARFVSPRGVHPHFAADPTRLYFNERASNTVGRGSDTAQTKLLSMTLDGHDVREHAQAPFAEEIWLSPNGSHVAVLENYQLSVSVLPQSPKILKLSPQSPAVPTRQVSSVGALFPAWSNDGRTVAWSIGAELKSVDIQSALQASEFDPQTRNLSIRYAAEQPDGQLAITGARIVTMNDAREVIENGTILIDGNRIAAIGASDELSPRADDKVLDVEGATVIPGLIDAHAHGPYGSQNIMNQQNWNLLGHLALGVTTMHDPSSTASMVFAAAEYARAGRIVSPRIYSTGEIVYGAKSLRWAQIKDFDDALSHVRRLKAQGALSIKNYNQPNRAQRQQVIEASRQENILTVAEGGSLYHMDLNLVADGTSSVEHNVPALRLYEDVKSLWAASDAAYVPTLVVTYGGLTAEDYFYARDEVWKHPILSRYVPPTVLQPRAVRRPTAPEADYRDDDAAADAKALMARGVMVGIGAHGQREGLASHWEMWSFARGGMTPMQALETATVNPAKHLGMHADIGSIEAGKLADLAIIDGNPLEDIRQSDRVKWVVLNGRVRRADTLAEVLTGDSALEPLWWHGTPGAEIR